MTPEQISAVTALANIVGQIGTWPIGTILLIVCLGPWVGLGIFTRMIEKRFGQALTMYEENVKLVKNYERLAQQQADTIRLNTAAITELITYLRARVPCHERLVNRFGG